MSKRRGLSHDEKRDRMKDLFLETKDVFTLKQLETCSLTGTVSQTVKEVLQSLVDDNLVKSEKIGTSNYFWCFPSDDYNTLEKLTEEVNTLKRKKKELEEEKETAQVGREESEERPVKLAKLRELQSENIQLKERMQSLAANNPEIVNAMKRDTKKAQDAANRWTDNIFTLRSHCTKDFGMEESAFNSNFGISDDFDYVEA